MKTISEALVEAKQPLVITGYCGRNSASVGALVELADTIKGLRVLDTGGSEMCFPANHRAWLSVRYGIHKAIEEADVILVMDCGIERQTSELVAEAELSQMFLGFTPNATRQTWRRYSISIQTP